MHTVTSGLEQIGKYFWWLVFFIVVGLASALLESLSPIEAFHLAWLDIAAMYGLIGLVSMAAALMVALLLARLETLAIRRQSVALQALPRAIVFVFFAVIWSGLFLRILVVNQVALPFLASQAYYNLAAAIVGVVLFIRFPRRLGDWIDRMAQRLRMMGVVSVISAIFFTGYLVLEPLTPPVLPPVTLSSLETPKPHVIVIVLDALTSRDMSLYGYHLPTTPQLEQITKTWTVFRNAHSGATGTLAVQPTILTGRYPVLDQWSRYGDLVRQGKGLLSLPDVLDSFGYHTIYGMGGGWSPSLYHFHTSFDRILGSGYSGIAYPKSIVHTMPGRDWLNSTVWNSMFVNDSLFAGFGALDYSVVSSYSEPMYNTAIQVLQKHMATPSAAPLFMYLHMNRPHQPYLADEFLGRFLPVEEGFTNIGDQKQFLLQPYSPTQQVDIDRLRLRYDENILKADQEVARLIKQLQQLGIYDKALIIITADHGTSFEGGSQGYWTEQLSAVEHSVPLLVKFPGQTEGQQVDTAVSLVDILPTVLDVVGASYPSEWVDGQPLSRTVLDPQRPIFVNGIDFSPVYNMDPRTVAAISGSMKLLQRGGEQFLYDLQNDPDEQLNLAREKPVECLRQSLAAFLERREQVTADSMFPTAPLPAYSCSADATMDAK